MKKCPFCAEEIQDEAIKCRHCNSSLVPAAGPTMPRVSAPPRAVPIPPEHTVIATQMHWAVFIRPAVWALLAIWSTYMQGVGVLSTIFIGLTLFDGVSSALVWSNTQYMITTRRLVMSTGMLRRRSFDMARSKVESIAVSTSLIGGLLGYGTVVVGGTGGSKEAFPMVPDPQAFRAGAQEPLAA